MENLKKRIQLDQITLLFFFENWQANAHSGQKCADSLTRLLILYKEQHIIALPLRMLLFRVLTLLIFYFKGVRVKLPRFA